MAASGDLVAVKDGTLYGTAEGGASGANDNLVKVDPKTGKRYPQMVYPPMLELLAYLAVLGVVVDRLLDRVAGEQLAHVTLEEFVVERVRVVEVARLAVAERDVLDVAVVGVLVDHADAVGWEKKINRTRGGFFGEFEFGHATAGILHTAGVINDKNDS